MQRERGLRGLPGHGFGQGELDLRGVARAEARILEGADPGAEVILDREGVGQLIEVIGHLDPGGTEGLRARRLGGAPQEGFRLFHRVEQGHQAEIVLGDWPPGAMRAHLLPDGDRFHRVPGFEGVQRGVFLAGLEGPEPEAFVGQPLDRVLHPFSGLADHVRIRRDRGEGVPGQVAELHLDLEGVQGAVQFARSAVDPGVGETERIGPQGFERRGGPQGFGELG